MGTTARGGCAHPSSWDKGKWLNWEFYWDYQPWPWVFGVLWGEGWLGWVLGAGGWVKATPSTHSWQGNTKLCRPNAAAPEFSPKKCLKHQKKTSHEWKTPEPLLLLSLPCKNLALRGLKSQIWAETIPALPFSMCLCQAESLCFHCLLIKLPGFVSMLRKDLRGG